MCVGAAYTFEGIPTNVSINAKITEIDKIFSLNIISFSKKISNQEQGCYFTQKGKCNADFETKLL